MDYIREELLRQGMALAALMVGGQPQEAHQEADSTTVRQEPDIVGLASALTEGTAEGTVPVESLAESPLRTRSQLNGKTGAAQRSRGTVPSGAARDSGRFLPPAAGEEGAAGVPVFRIVSGYGETADIQAMSRAIQRDARRYDGGFSIF